jgi:glutathionyl-hydroquinone reductase
LRLRKLGLQDRRIFLSVRKSYLSVIVTAERLEETDMKAMIDSEWRADLAPAPEFQEKAERSRFRGRVTADGLSGFKAEAGRYHLYVSYACPFAHRTLLARRLIGLCEIVSASILDPDWGGPQGWVFNDGPMATPDHVNGLATLSEVYRLANPGFTGRVTVPVLFDKEQNTIVSNESADIMRMLEIDFAAFGNTTVDLYPEALRAEIDALNAFIGPRVNGGVYRVGFARTQEDHDAAIVDLFDALDHLERHLEGRTWLAGECLTEADLRLFATLVRFDAAYYGALNCNLRRLVDYPALWAHTRRIYQIPGVAETVRIDHVKRHYYDDHPMINRRIVPMGPLLDFVARAA